MTASRLLRTIRFDGTDAFVFEQAAPPDEWAISGAFAFSNQPQEAVVGKVKQAFANGFLSVESFGRATFTCVAEIDPEIRTHLQEHLAQHFVDHYGAPDLAAALPVAREEFNFVSNMVADVPINTIFVVQRKFDDDGQIREQFRKIEQRIAGGPIYPRAWEDSDGS